MTHYFIEALDVLHFRGNTLFGAPGSYGATQALPRPSVVAGALRSALMVHKGIDPAAFAAGRAPADPDLGTLNEPGPFRVTGLQLARRHPGGSVEPLYIIPADLVVEKSAAGSLQVRYLYPHTPAKGIESSTPTQQLPVLAQPRRAKPATGYWLTAAGWSAYLHGEPIDPDQHLVSNTQLWCLEQRVGIGMDSVRRRAANGQLFSTEALNFRRHEHNPSEETPDIGLLVQAEAAELPDGAALRLGGDGRAATAYRVQPNDPEPDWATLARQGRCRMVLTTPGHFAAGWLPTGMDESSADFQLHGVKGALSCSAVPRAEVISGWDLARWEPKPAHRVAPAGSVYWLNPIHAEADQLQNLVSAGLWNATETTDFRQVEGFNRIALAAYPN